MLCWNLPDYLDESLVKPVVGRLWSLLKPGGMLLAFFHTQEAGPDAPCYRYHIVGGDVLEMHAHRSRRRKKGRAAQQVPPAARLQQSQHRKSFPRFCLHQILSRPRQHPRSPGRALAGPLSLAFIFLRCHPERVMRFACESHDAVEGPLSAPHCCRQASNHVGTAAPAVPSSAARPPLAENKMSGASFRRTAGPVVPAWFEVNRVSSFRLRSWRCRSAGARVHIASYIPLTRLAHQVIGEGWAIFQNRKDRPANVSGQDQHPANLRGRAKHR